MTPPPADPVRARASCVVIVAWRVPHPRVSVFREGGSGRPPLCVSMNKANLSVAGAARAGQGWAGLGWAGRWMGAADRLPGYSLPHSTLWGPAHPDHV